MRGALATAAALCLVACGPSARTCKQNSDCSGNASCDLSIHFCVLNGVDAGTGGGTSSVGGGGGSTGGGTGGGATGGGSANGGGTSTGGGGAMGGGTGGGLVGCTPACDAGTECFDGGCRCTTSTCSGCCAGNDCAPGSDPAACGANGNACAACNTGDSCANGACQGCVMSCAQGCCVGDTCNPSSVSTCGVSGAACAACAPRGDGCDGGTCGCGSGPSCLAGQSCDAGNCECDSTSCASGCCSGTTCTLFASQSSSQCGGSGQTCAACDANSADSCINGQCTCGSVAACVAGQHCQSGQCVCDTASCASGCCTATVGGTCVGYGSESGGQCGAGGALCAACGSGQHCNASGQCVCDATSCTNGCCTATVGGTCVAYGSESSGQCGAGGALCSACTAGERCNASGQCVCDATSCPSGCCTATLGGSCIAYGSESNGQCGAAGAVCSACTSSQHCNASGQCVCDSSTCIGGCCTSAVGGTCIPYGSQGNTQCGGNGAICASCTSSQHCSVGQCQCDGTSCAGGCCTATIGGSCVAYGSESNGQCGAAGAQCAACTISQHCALSGGNSGHCVCDGTSCAAGCCTQTVNGMCVPYASESFSQCGSAGAICGGCASGQRCNGLGLCVCDATSCAAGCCTATLNGSCVAYGAETNGQCGAAGAVCAGCTGSQHCNGSGQCICDSTTCGGCCTSTVGGSCIPTPSESNTQCGLAGTVCFGCATGQRCSSGACVCDSTSCPAGCCTTATGSCITYVNETDLQCGQAGGLCHKCAGGTSCGGTGQCI